MINLNMSIPNEDIHHLQEQFSKYVQWFKKGPKEAVKKTCVYIIRSLRADTRKSKEFRKIVKNPVFKKATSKRSRQLSHIREWYEKRNRTFIDTADYFSRYAIERLTQKDGRKFYTTIPLASNVGEAKRVAQTSLINQYTIKKRGLANDSWGWMLGKLGDKAARMSYKFVMGITNVHNNEDFESGGYSIEMTNKLNYIRKAMKQNEKSVILRASKSMKDEMEGHAKRAAREAGLSAA